MKPEALVQVALGGIPEPLADEDVLRLRRRRSVAAKAARRRDGEVDILGRAGMDTEAQFEGVASLQEPERIQLGLNEEAREEAVERYLAAQAHEVDAVRAGGLLEAFGSVQSPMRLPSARHLGGVHGCYQPSVRILRQLCLEELAPTHEPAAQGITNRLFQGRPTRRDNGDVRQRPQRRGDTVPLALLPIFAGNDATMDNDSGGELAAEPRWHGEVDARRIDVA